MPTVISYIEDELVTAPRQTARLPRGVAKRERELRDPIYRARSQEARAELAKEFSAVMPETLATLRLQRGMSQQELAKKIGTSQPHIAKIEAGKVKLFLETAGRLSDALQISVDHLRGLVAIDQPDLAKTTVVPEL